MFFLKDNESFWNIVDEMYKLIDQNFQQILKSFLISILKIITI